MTLPMMEVDRFERLARMEREAEAIYRSALELCEGREITGIVILFSGGNDSTVLAHKFRDLATHAMHANTGIGIEETRQFVRDCCQNWDLSLLERHPRPGRGYRDLVLGNVMNLRTGQPVAFRGFPGPASHRTMFAFLKERSVDQVKRELVTRPVAQRVIFLSGIRRAESSRRRATFENPVDVTGSGVWVKPLLRWTAEDMNTYRMVHDVPVNEVADLLHMSGECLCGAFAHEGELDEIGEWFPGFVKEIRELERDVQLVIGSDDVRCRWGWGAGKERPSPAGPMCSSCEWRQESLF